MLNNVKLENFGCKPNDVDEEGDEYDSICFRANIPKEIEENV